MIQCLLPAAQKQYRPSAHQPLSIHTADGSADRHADGSRLLHLPLWHLPHEWHVTTSRAKKEISLLPVPCLSASSPRLSLHCMRERFLYASFHSYKYKKASTKRCLLFYIYRLFALSVVGLGGNALFPAACLFVLASTAFCSTFFGPT